MAEAAVRTEVKAASMTLGPPGTAVPRTVSVRGEEEEGGGSPRAEEDGAVVSGAAVAREEVAVACTRTVAGTSGREGCAPNQMQPNLM